MKIPGLIVTLVLVAFAFAPAKLNAQSSQKQALFCQAKFTEAWTGFVRWAAIQDCVGRGTPRYAKLARVRDGDLAFIGRGQDVLDVHYTDKYDQKIF